MRAISIIFRRELAAYFATPLAYVFIVVFLVLAGSLTFFLGSFFDRGQADLQPFFTFHPWLYLFLIPAIAMRLWAEERKTGTIELFLTLPVTTAQAVLGKFLAAWAFCGIALCGLIASYHGILYATSRQAFALGRGGYLPRPLGAVHATRRTPTTAVRLAPVWVTAWCRKPRLATSGRSSSRSSCGSQHRSSRT